MGDNKPEAEWDGNAGALTTDGSGKHENQLSPPLFFFLSAESWGFELWTPQSSLGDTRH